MDVLYFREGIVIEGWLEEAFRIYSFDSGGVADFYFAIGTIVGEGWGGST